MRETAHAAARTLNPGDLLGPLRITAPSIFNLDLRAGKSFRVGAGMDASLLVDAGDLLITNQLLAFTHVRMGP